MIVAAVVGWHRGLVAQVAAVLALVVGICVGAWVDRWVGARWTGAHPALIFSTLKWLVAVSACLAVVTMLTLFGDRLGARVQKGAVGWLDRAFGVPAGAAIGLALAGLVTLAAASLPVGHEIQHAVATARSPRWLLAAGSRACDAAEAVPGALATGSRFDAARHRLARFATSKT